jgi:hypothetical protein
MSATVLAAGQAAAGSSFFNTASSFFGPQYGFRLRASTSRTTSSAAVARPWRCGARERSSSPFAPSAP